MSFICTDHGSINLRCVIRVSDATTGRGSIVWYLEGDDVRQTRTFEEVEDVAPVQIIAAAPGYSVVEIDTEAPFKVFPPLPVVAWRVAGDNVSPMTIGEQSGNAAVLLPDGRVVEPCGQDYLTVEVYRKARVERLTRRQARVEAEPTEVAA